MWQRNQPRKAKFPVWTITGEGVLSTVIEGLNQITKVIHMWCIDNKLTVNTEKTEAMLVTNCPFIGPLQKLRFGEEQINFTDSAKCLGVWIDRGLNWNKQIKVVTQKYNSKLCQLKRMGRLLQAKDLEEIYFKSIIPCVVYCIVVWEQSVQQNLGR